MKNNTVKFSIFIFFSQAFNFFLFFVFCLFSYVFFFTVSVANTGGGLKFKEISFLLMCIIIIIRILHCLKPVLHNH